MNQTIRDTEEDDKAMLSIEIGTSFVNWKIGRWRMGFSITSGGHRARDRSYAVSVYDFVANIQSIMNKQRLLHYSAFPHCLG